MKKITLSIITGVAAVGLLLSGTSAASAASYTSYPDGGTFSHGTSQVGGTNWKAWSNYYHAKKSHRSSVQWAGKAVVRSTYVGPGSTSSAVDFGATSAKAYYAFS